MDFGTIGENAPLIVVAVIVLVLLQIFLRKSKPEAAEQEVVQSLLLEVRVNQALLESFHLWQKPRKFEMVSWRRNKTKLDFLNQSLQSALSDAFGMAEDVNQRVVDAKKYKSASYLVGINIDKLKEPLAKSKEGLEEWLLMKLGTIDPSPKYPGLLDGWFGGRR